MMRRHFWDVHPKDLVVKVEKEGKFRRCWRCGMQVNPMYTGHQNTKEWQVGVKRKQQREAAVTSALALRQQFSVHGEALERVEVFKYLGRLLVQDDDDIQAIRAQLRKTRGTWARVGQVLRAENAPPRIATKFYKALVQAVLLHGSETWVLSTAALATLEALVEGFHICAAYRMAVRHKPRRGPGNMWVYPKSKDVLEECGMSTLEEYITIRRQTIAVYVATRPLLIECRQGERKWGAVPHRWWWKQQMDLDLNDAIGSVE